MGNASPVSEPLQVPVEGRHEPHVVEHGRMQESRELARRLHRGIDDGSGLVDPGRLVGGN